MKPSLVKVAIPEATRFIVDCLCAVGAKRKAAEQQATLLIEAEKLGHPSHGMNRLEYYVNDIETGACEPHNQPVVVKESDSVALIDAKNVLGATSSHIAMDKAIEKARNTGVGWVVVKGANHNGICGFWAQKAADAGMIGMSFTNTSPLMAPTRSKQAALGTNSFSVVAPANCGLSFYHDMATTAVALGKIEMQRRKGEPILPGWAQGVDGNETLDAEEAAKVQRLFPLGGGESTSGYKGFGLGAMVELLTGISSGSKYGHHIRKWTTSGTGEKANLGHCFIAVNIDCLAPGFCDRLTDCILHWRTLTPLDPNLPVLAPGDKEKQKAAEAETTGMILFLKQQIDSCATLADKLSVKPMDVS